MNVKAVGTGPQRFSQSKIRQQKGQKTYGYARTVPGSLIMKVKGLELKALGILVSELTDEQLNNYVKAIVGFERIVGRYPDYFEEKDIISQAKRELL